MLEPTHTGSHEPIVIISFQFHISDITLEAWNQLGCIYTTEMANATNHAFPLPLLVPLQNRLLTFISKTLVTFPSLLMQINFIRFLGFGTSLQGDELYLLVRPMPNGRGSEWVSGKSEKQVISFQDNIYLRNMYIIYYYLLYLYKILFSFCQSLWDEKVTSWLL